MTAREFEKVLRNKSMSDEKIVEIALTCVDELLKEYRNRVGELSTKIKKLYNLTEKLRPNVNRMIEKMVTKKHKNCCNPKSKKQCKNCKRINGKK